MVEVKFKGIISMLDEECTVMNTTLSIIHFYRVGSLGLLHEFSPSFHWAARVLCFELFYFVPTHIPTLGRSTHTHSHVGGISTHAYSNAQASGRAMQATRRS